MFVTTFILGVVAGMFARQSVTAPASSTQAAAIQQWNETEEDTRKRMAVFQQRLDQLEKQSSPDTVDRLVKDMELQNGIDDVLIKYREAQQSKFAPVQTLAGAVVGSLITLLGTWLTWRKPKTSAPTA